MATKLPSGAYRAQVFIGVENGKRKYKSFIADTANAADLAALQYKAEHKDTRNAGSFQRAAEKFLETSSHVLSPYTLRGYRGILRALKADHPSFCALSLSGIGRAELQRLINDAAADRSPKTVRNYISFIDSVLAANGIRRPLVTLPKKRRKEMNIPDEETLRRLLAAVRGTEWEIPVLLGAIVPMRRGEIVGADISDLSDDNVLHIHTAVAITPDNEVVRKGPKTTASDRYVQLPAQIADKIRAQGYICNINIKNFSRDFARVLRKAGIEHFRFHDLRHAFVSIAHAEGIPNEYIMSRGGWSTESTMVNVYRHVLDDEKKRKEAAVNARMSEILLRPEE